MPEPQFTVALSALVEIEQSPFTEDDPWTWGWSCSLGNYKCRRDHGTDTEAEAVAAAVEHLGSVHGIHTAGEPVEPVPMTDPEAPHEDTGPPSKFTDWPENLPREELIRLLRGYAWKDHQAAQIIATAFPDEYPLGDGEIIPADERVVFDEDSIAMAEKAVAKIDQLRASVYSKINRRRDEHSKAHELNAENRRLRVEVERLTKKYDGMNHIASLAIDSLNRLAGYPTDYAHGDTYEAALKRMREAG